MKSALFVFSVAFAAASVCSYADDIRDYSTYCKLTKDVTIYNVPPSASYWDPQGDMVDAGYYLVPAGITLTSTRNESTTSPATMPGMELAIAGTFNFDIWIGRGDSVATRRFIKTPRLALLPGGKITSKAAYPTVFGDTLDIRGTAENPSLLDYAYTDATANKRNYHFRLEIAFTGDKDSVVKFMRTSSNGLDYDRSFQFTKGFDNFFGTILVDKRAWLRPASGLASFVIPGAIQLDGGNLEVAYQNLTVGSLTIGSGSTVKIAADKYITVTNSLSIADGAVIVLDGLSNKISYGGSSSELPEILVLSAKGEVAAQGVDRTALLAAIVRGSHTLGGTFVAGIPRLKLVERNREDGGVDFLVSHDPIVKLVQSSYYANGPFNHGQYEGYLSDGDELTGKEDFVNGGNSFLFNGNANFTFPGRSCTLTGNSVGFYSGQKLITEDLRIVGESSCFRQMSKNINAYLDGNITVFGTMNLRVHGTGAFYVQANISGVGDTMVALDVDKINEHKSAWRGTLDVSGDNSGYKGRFLVGCGTANDNIGQTNLTLRVSEAKHLGGDLDAFTFDGVAISKACTLSITYDAVFVAKNRGWCFRDGSSVSVAEGKTAIMEETVTLGGVCEKKGPGALILGGGVKFYDAEKNVAIDTPNGASLKISQGALGVASSDALKGVALTFANGAKLLSSVEGSGIVLDSAPVIEGEMLEVEIVEWPDSGIVPLNLFRLPATDVLDASKFHIVGKAGYKVGEVKSRIDGECVVYYSSVTKLGLSITIR